MSYNYLTFAQARALISSRLNDPNNVFWLDDELKVALIESLRTWNALTGYFRDRATFSTSNAVAWYDLTSVLSPGLRSLNVTDQQTFASIQYALLENNTGVASGNTVSTDQFTAAQITQALQRRRDEFLEETGIVLKRYANFSITPANQARYALPDDTIIDVRRAVWIDTSSGTKTTLFRQDEFQSSAYSPGWAGTSNTTPQVYSIAVEPPLTISFDVGPPTGHIDLVTTNSGAALNPSTPVVLGVPDDWAWVIRWGALATLLSQDGPAPDPERAAYCEARWRMGLAIARLAPSVVACLVGGADSLPTSVNDLDSYNPSWENIGATTGNPVSQLALAGVNLVALSPVPGSTTVTVTIDCVKNAPVPSADGDFLQIGREALEPVLAYAQHCLSFKIGGSDFRATAGLLREFMAEAATYADRLSAYSPSAVTFAREVYKEAQRVLRRKSDEAQTPATLAPQEVTA